MNRHHRRAAKARGTRQERPTHVRPLNADDWPSLAAATDQARLTAIVEALRGGGRSALHALDSTARLDEVADRAGLPDLAETLREISCAPGLMCEITSRQQTITTADLSQDVPALMVVNDYYSSTGPAPWRGAAALAEWAKFAVIQSTPEPFEAAAEAVESWARVVLIKTSAKFLHEWAERFRGKHVLTVLVDRFTEWTPQSGQHPRLPAWETLQ